MLAIALAIVGLLAVVFLLGALGYWSATLLVVKPFLARLGTRVTARLADHFGDEQDCGCLACHHFQGVDLPMKAKHKLLPRLAGVVAQDMATEIEIFLAKAAKHA